ncbi:MAG: hypothetical protein ABIJ57_02315 [Pseudomonadota bacterium]
MELGEALSIAKQLKSHFRAFEKLDEFVKEIASREAMLKNNQDKFSAGEREIAEARIKQKITKENLEASILKTKEEADRTISDLNKRMQEKRALWKKTEEDLIQKEQRLQKAIADLENEARTKVETLSLKEKEITSVAEKERLEALESITYQVEIMEGRLSTARAALENIKKNLG